MTGSAYRTDIRAHTEFGAFISGAVVYAVFPPALSVVGVSSHVIVSSVLRSSDTQIYACDETGFLVSWVPVEVTPGLDHARALRAAGYHMEVVA